MSEDLSGGSARLTVEALRAERDRIRREMGGRDKVAAIRASGRMTAREHIDALVDDASFQEIGLFARSARAEDRSTTPGDGKIAGFARIHGQLVGIVADDGTVKRATSSTVGTRKIERVFEQCVREGSPFIHLGETGGARLPETLTAVGYAGDAIFPFLTSRRGRIPVITAIIGESFGGSSFYAGLSDLVVQVAGTTLAITAPRVIEIATTEQVTNEQLGGTDVHATKTGQVDIVVATHEEVAPTIRRFLALVRTNARPTTPLGSHVIEPDRELAALVADRRERAYDMRKVIAAIVDGGAMLELRPRWGRSLITALAQIGGVSVGIIASQPMHEAGTLSPAAFDKLVRTLRLCEMFELPVVVLQDTPGVMVGTSVEHDQLLFRAMNALQAWSLSTVPKLVVVLRKAFGLAFFAIGGTGMGADLLVAWPGAEIGFMDPSVATNVLPGAPVDVGQFDPMLHAEHMHIDDVIDPAETRAILAMALRRTIDRPSRPVDERPLLAWPTGI